MVTPFPHQQAPPFKEPTEMSFKQRSRPGHLGHVVAMLPHGEGILAILAMLQKQALFPKPSATNRQHRHPTRERATVATTATNSRSCAPPCAHRKRQSALAHAPKTSPFSHPPVVSPLPAQTCAVLRRNLRPPRVRARLQDYKFGKTSPFSLQSPRPPTSHHNTARPFQPTCPLGSLN